MPEESKSAKNGSPGRIFSGDFAVWHFRGALPGVGWGSPPTWAGLGLPNAGYQPVMGALPFRRDCVLCVLGESPNGGVSACSQKTIRKTLIRVFLHPLIRKKPAFGAKMAREAPGFKIRFGKTEISGGPPREPKRALFGIDRKSAFFHRGELFIA